MCEPASAKPKKVAKTCCSSEAPPSFTSAKMHPLHELCPMHVVRTWVATSKKLDMQSRGPGCIPGQGVMRKNASKKGS